ncbi:hypothetical protein BCAH1134_C0407 (plasmid) [Bacillus cereus AH1134]|nr:hypothetical protein BCAH1134_C0407 [Bacillus cereus AH1134]
MTFFLDTNNDNYVNKLSIWAAYFIFCLAWVYFRNADGTPHKETVEIACL